MSACDMISHAAINLFTKALHTTAFIALQKLHNQYSFKNVPTANRSQKCCFEHCHVPQVILFKTNSIDNYNYKYVDSERTN